ncbi:MAG: polysaccharide biosynthesis tyrosine autokinase, partial [Flavobacterium sp.]|nr:polysaccharide biosynthesis tyrosine autokinase [Flavobacterium sp.]
MIDTKDFSFFENQNSFDFKGFLIKIVSYWKWFLISLTITFAIAYQVNIRKQKIYALQTSIAIKEENNPFFTSNTSLVFNWGGSSDQVQNISNTLKSRSHNELVVDELQFYVDYLQKGDYNYKDVYGDVPFALTLDKSKGQLLNNLIEINFVSATSYELHITFENASAPIMYYANHSKGNAVVVPGEFKKQFRLGEQIQLPFLNGKLESLSQGEQLKGKTYFIRFNNFDEVVQKGQNISVEIDPKAASILVLSMQGPNKNRIVNYLNTTVNTLIKTQLDRKNQFATNTIEFIDSTLVSMGNQLKETGDELTNFNKRNNIVEIEKGGENIAGQLLEYDITRDQINRKIAYCNSLKSYLRNSVDYSKLPAPTVAGIDDPNIVTNVAKLIGLSAQRSQLAYSVKSEKIFQEFDSQMEAVKKVLLENVASIGSAFQYDLVLVNSKIQKIENDIKQLPEDKQEYLKISRKYDLSDNIYNTFLQKRSEAEIVKAANLSDIHFIDSAKDTGGGLIGPNTSVNYVIAFFMGILIPLLVVFGIFFMENAILNTEDITSLTDIPIIGVIGVKQSQSNLAVFERPKSALSESFRAIRSSLQFLYKKHEIEGTKTIMLTSSISGEGKTFCSLNIATVFALSEKKTVIVGLDLRKPKIFDDFNTTNEIGVVNYLIGQKNMDEVIQKTQIPYLDVITSGPIPPNPSELIIGDTMKKFMEELKSRYDYIILDTPPVGLVSDALELDEYVDVSLYIMRQNYTKKDMVTM